MKKVLLLASALILCLLLCVCGACAESCFTLDVDLLHLDRLNSDEYVQQALSSSAQGICVRKFISDSSELAAPVRLTLKQMNSGAVLFDRDYGYQSGTFDSGVIYLPYAGDGTDPYLVTLYLGNYVYAMPFMHQPSRLSHNGSCTVGVRLRDLDATLSGDWFMGTMVDLDALRQSGSTTVELCASNSYLIGAATLSLSGGSLCVSVHFTPSAQVEVSQQSLYVVTDVNAFSSAPARSVGEWIDVGGASSALIYLPMQLSYDPAGLPGFSYNSASSEVRRQISLWNENRAASASRAVPAGGQSSVAKETIVESVCADDTGWNDDGWAADGWDDISWDANYGWEDDWSGSADGWE